MLKIWRSGCKLKAGEKMLEVLFKKGGSLEGRRFANTGEIFVANSELIL